MSECSDIVQLEDVTRAFAGAKAVDGLSLKFSAPTAPARRRR